MQHDKQDILHVKVKQFPERLLKALTDRSFVATLAKDRHHSMIQVDYKNGIEKEIFRISHAKRLEIRFIGSKATNLEDVFVSLFNNTRTQPVGEVYD